MALLLLLLRAAVFIGGGLVVMSAEPPHQPSWMVPLINEIKALNNITQELTSELERQSNTIGDLQESLSQMRSDFTECTEQQNNAIGSKLEQQSNAIGGKLEQQSNAIEGKLEQQSNAIGGKLEQQSNAIGDLKKSMNELHIFLPQYMKTTLEGSYSNITQEHQEIINSLQQCSSREQLNDFRDLLATDECFEGSHNCNEFASCTDEMINYQCNCLPGYSGDGFACQDIDECISGNNTCNLREICVNEPGSYNCICKEGYKREGNTCPDINECESGVHDCDTHADCTNTIGSYICQCHFSYKGDGRICQAQVCESPSKSIEGLGCITPVMVYKSMDDAQTNCKRTGTRLLENFETEHFPVLLDHFPLLNGQSMWVGIRQWQFVETTYPLGFDLWYPGKPGRSHHECVHLYLRSSTSGLRDSSCSTTWFSFCQLPY